MEAIHEGGEALIVFAQPARRMEHRGVEARVEVEQEPPELRFELLAVEVAQRNSPAETLRGRRCAPNPPSLSICSPLYRFRATAPMGEAEQGEGKPPHLRSQCGKSVAGFASARFGARTRHRSGLCRPHGRG